MRKIKVAKIDNIWWYYPRNIFTISKRSWVPRSYKNLKKMLVNEKFWDENVIINTNKDKDLSIYRLLQQYKNLNFTISSKIQESILSNGYFDYKVPKIKIIWRIDKKGLNFLLNGLLPFNNLEFFRNFLKGSNRKKTKIILWRRHGFIEQKESKYENR